MQHFAGFAHLGGGRHRLFLLLRYLFIIGAAYLLIFQAPLATLSPAVAGMIAAALASNVALSLVPGQYVFAWYVEAPVLIADTLWVSWALHATGSAGQDFFLLYSFVLFLAVLSESTIMILLGSTLVSVASVYFGSDGNMYTTPQLLRIVFFYIVALFYGHALTEIRRERRRADRGFAWARELEAKVAERTEELRRLYDESLAASRVKTELMANMSHELRTPLHVILGYAEMLTDWNANADCEPMIRGIREAARAQLELIEGVLALGKLESGKMPVVDEVVSLDRFIAALQARERLPVTPGVVLRWEIPPGLPVVVTDPVKLAAVVDNLVNNAIKFTTKGSVAIRVRDLPGVEQVEFQVEDTGPGIAGEHLAKIFEPFHQLAAPASAANGGVGLGLTIVWQYTELLGGEVKVCSEVGRGTTFAVTFPYRRTDVRCPAPASAAA